VECLEIDRLLIRGAVLLTAIEDTEPCERQGPDGRLLGFALGALLLVGALSPAGMPERCRCPRSKRLAAALWTREAPVPPSLCPAACGDRGNPRLFVPFGSARIAGALVATGNAQAGSAERSRAWEGLEEGEVGRALGPRRHSGVEGSHGLPGAAARGHQRWDQQGMGGDDALSGGQRRGRLEGVAALGAHVFCADKVVAAAGLKGGAAREWGRCEGGPAPQKVTETVGLCILQPLAHLRARVFQRPGEAVRQPPCIPAHAPPVCDELCEGAPGRAVRREWRQLIPLRAQPCELQVGVAGIIFGPARGAGFPIPRPGQRLDRAEEQTVRRAQGKAQRPLVQCEAERDGLAVHPRPQCGAPRIKSRGRVRTLDALSFCSASRLEASILGGLRPGDAHTGRPGVVCRRCQASSPDVCESGEQGQAR
jgi:hypothetical protein